MVYVDGFPRRNRIECLIPTEKAIYDVVQTIEELGAHPALTDVVIMLQEVRSKLADWAEETGNIKPVE